MRGRLLLAAVVVPMVAVLIWQWVRLPEPVPAKFGVWRHGATVGDTPGMQFPLPTAAGLAPGGPSEMNGQGPSVARDKIDG